MSQKKSEIIRDVMNPLSPADPATHTDNTLYLSDAKWEKAFVGWEKPARNFYSMEHETTFFLENKGTLYSKGLFAHSPSLCTFNLNKKWNRFTAIAGIRDRAHSEGSARFTVLGDGKVLYESPALRANQQDEISIDIKGVSILQLKANGTEGHNNNSWAVWLNPLIER